MKNYLPTITKIIFFIMTHSLAYGEIPLVPLKADEVISYAKTAIGSSYELGFSHWDPKNRRYGGVDCGGLVQKAWRWPVPLPYKERMKDRYKVAGKKTPGKLFTGDMLLVKKYDLPWSVSSDLSKARVGDVMTVYNGGKTGHTFIVAGYDEENDKIKTLEARNPKYDVGFFSRTMTYLKNVNYKLMKRNNFSGGAVLNIPSKKTEAKAPAKTQSSSGSNSSSSSQSFHTLKAGENLWILSKQYKVTVSHLEKLNPQIKDQRKMKVGSKIRVK